jgi:ATP-dependent protease ClpP protease subunit
MSVLNKTSQELIERGILDLAGDVDSKMTEYVRAAIPELMARGAPPLTVWISSGGGGVRSGLFIYDMLGTYPNTTTGIVICEAKSMAVIILQACTIRKALANSEIRIHGIVQPDVGLDVFHDPKKLEELKNELELQQAKTDQILLKRTEKSIKEIRRASGLEKDMTVKEAIEFGLLDCIHVKEKKTPEK